MDTDALIADLRDRGVELRAMNGDLEVRPRLAVPPHLLAELEAREPEIVRRLTAPAVADPLGGVSPILPAEPGTPSALVAEVCAMRLDDFARAGLVVTVWIQVLSERVIFASDNARVDPGELRTVYPARELRALLGLRDLGELRRIHE